MDIKEIKSKFPIFSNKVKGKKLVYLDSANSSQKPKVVIDRISNFYSKLPSIALGLVSRHKHSLEPLGPPAAIPAKSGILATPASFRNRYQQQEVCLQNSCCPFFAPHSALRREQRS